MAFPAMFTNPLFAVSADTNIQFCDIDLEGATSNTRYHAPSVRWEDKAWASLTYIFKYVAIWQVDHSSILYSHRLS